MSRPNCTLIEGESDTFAPSRKLPFGAQLHLAHVGFGPHFSVALCDLVARNDWKQLALRSRKLARDWPRTSGQLVLIARLASGH